jgi:hypothetical protein
MLILALALTACQRAPTEPETPGDRLEAAAIARGLVADPTRAGIVGSWARDGDRICVVPHGKAHRLGVAIDYGEGQGCVASGTAGRDGEQLRVRFGDCAFNAAFDGERITFPPELPAPCARLCTGRATLSALSVERLSASASEAAAMRAPNGRPLCTTG